MAGIKLSRKGKIIAGAGWLVGMAAMLLTSGLIACSGASPSSPNDMGVDESFDGKEVRMAPGGALQVALDSNPTTGFKWELTRISDTTVIEKVSNVFETPQYKVKAGEQPPVGAGGKEFWNFKALKKGIASISMEYSRPWAGGEKGVNKFDMTVVVE